ncbi:DUF6114 domain-containing protein [Isoptericola sp. G70]|uniref:DUF6114 domain-containing protein n=1 Tax=Isoptericola sp. G70 TaxID=3376633 RepID=UPI003A80AEC8
MRFAGWRRTRPFAGGVLAVLAGVVLWFSGRLRIDGFEIQLGIEGMQTTLLPLVLVLLGALLLAQPQFRVFYGILTIGIAVYSLLGVNLGGFGIGMVLGVVGGILAVSWLPRDVAPDAPGATAAPETPEATEATGSREAPDDGAAPEPVEVPDGGPRHSAAVGALAALALAVAPLPAEPAASGAVRGPVLCDWFGVTCPDDPEGDGDAEPSPSPSAGDDAADGGPDDGAGSDGAEDASDEPQDGDDEPAPPKEDGPPVTQGGREDADVFSVPGELKSEDLRMEGLQSVSVVSVPAATPSGRRLALKIVADRVELDGFRLKTYADAGTGDGGTITEAGRVTLEGDAAMYLTSLRAGLPDGERLVVDPEDPPTLTGWLLALANPTIGFLGAVSEEQVWSSFREQVWED